MKKDIYLLFNCFIFLALIKNIRSQTNPWQVPYEISCYTSQADVFDDKSFNCSKSSSEYNDYYNRFQFYNDNFDNFPTLTISINIIVWQKDDGSENWQDIQETHNRFDMIFIWLNNHYKNSEPSYFIENVVDYETTKIKFVWFYHELSEKC